MKRDKNKNYLVETGEDDTQSQLDEIKDIPPKHVKYRKNRAGLIEGYDPETGRILSMQASHRDLVPGKNLQRYETPEGPVYLEAGLSLNIIPKNKVPEFSQLLADMLMEYILDGFNVRQACQAVGISYRTFSSWRRENQGFREELALCYQDRAELFHDKAIEVASQKMGDTARDKLYVDTLKWAAEKGDAEKYGAKTKIVGDKNAPIHFVVETGIRRPGDPGFTEEEEVASGEGLKKLNEKDEAEDITLVKDVTPKDVGVENE